MPNKKRKVKPQQDIIILKNGQVRKLKAPYTPEQAQKFRNGG